jgi:hypothetical protein
VLPSSGNVSVLPCLCCELKVFLLFSGSHLPVKSEFTMCLSFLSLSLPPSPLSCKVVAEFY